MADGGEFYKLTTTSDNFGWYTQTVYPSITGGITVDSDNWLPVKSMDWSKINEKDITSILPDIKTNLPEGVEMKTLYEVWLVYAENRKKPIIMKKEGIIADNEEDAKIRSGLMKDINDTWDTDYLTVICIEVASVKVKSKPKEVKTV
ncbi:hypothetical protein LCGC14_2647560 [marine sediment metagenome]|uniref:Uncharacterized protein n=1 Tax=marine sediment metagenome TaxID=412755 RepID=A0A0F9AI48_9ZZZZ